VPLSSTQRADTARAVDRPVPKLPKTATLDALQVLIAPKRQLLKPGAVLPLVDIHPAISSGAGPSISNTRRLAVGKGKVRAVAVARRDLVPPLLPVRNRPSNWDGLSRPSVQKDDLLAEIADLAAQPLDLVLRRPEWRRPVMASGIA